MPVINVSTALNTYNIHIKNGIRHNPAEFLKPYNNGQKWVIFTHPSLNKLYGKELQSNLINSEFEVLTLTMPEGEDSKTILNVNDLYGQLLDLNCGRSTTFIALGGGVVGDVTGFVASTFMRGVGYVQIPTTLLAMVDSSVGGKTGVNLEHGKNLVGTFYQPLGVFIDPVFLRSLPIREMVSGLAEILKTAVIRDAEFFRNTAGNLLKLMAYSEDAPFVDVISAACRIKAEIVSRDEKELDLRRILNFGHTVGHGLETAQLKPKLQHGEAVAYGMLAAGYLSHRYGTLTSNEWQELRDVIWQLPLPELKYQEKETILARIKHDKKHVGKALNFVLLNSLGDAETTQKITTGQIGESIEHLFKMTSGNIETHT